MTRTNEKDSPDSSHSSCAQTFPNDDNNEKKTINKISACEESFDNEDDDSPDTYEHHASPPPIVVGYAFGPKKMSTMSSVMEKATLWDPPEITTNTTQQPQVVFTVGESDLGLMLGHLAASSEESMGTCTASYASSSTTTGRSRQAAWRLPPITFVPMESEDDAKTTTPDIILHKLTEDILCTRLLAEQHPILRDLRQVPASMLSTLPLTQTEHATVRRVHRLCQPNCIVLDDPVRVQTLLNRADICHTLTQCLSSLPNVQCPASTIITNTHNLHGLQFPVILKPLIAAGTQSSHHMAILFCDSPLAEPHIETSWLAQEYRNHGSVLYKVYVLGEHVSVHPRRSLPDLPAAGGHSLWFDSQRPYPRPSDFGLSSTNTATTTATTSSRHLPPLTVQQVQPIAVALKQAFQLELFGFDVILEATDEKEPMMWVVDVNYFPSYKEVPQFPALLAQFLTQRVLQRQQQQQSSGT